jgi:hypothetical protein
MRTFMLAAVSVLLMPFAGPMLAQEASLAVWPGQRVRVEAPALFVGWRVGEVLSVERDTLHVRYARGQVRARIGAIPLASVTRVQARVERRSAVGKGVALGSLAGAAVGVMGVVAYVSGVDETVTIGQALGVTALGGLGGGMIGFVIGAAVRTDVWRDVRVPRPMVTVRRDGSIGVGLALQLPF